MRKIVPIITVGSLLVAGSSLGAAQAFAKEVTLSVDGQDSRTSVIHATVAEVLVDQGVTLTARDEVTPSLTTLVSNGTVIDVRYARPVTLTLDGITATRWLTTTTVADALTALGIVDPSADVSAEPTSPITRDGVTLVVDTGKDVTVTAAGSSHSVHTTGTVADALQAAGVTVGNDDIVTPALTDALVDGLAITHVAVTTTTITKDIDLPFTTETTQDATLATGTTTVKTKGAAGKATETWTQVLHDGQVFSEEKVSTATVSEPVTQIVVKGTKPAATATPTAAAPSSPTSTATSAAAVSGVWAALAQCESGGNPKAVNPAGYYGLYQFTVQTWQSVGGSGLPSDASAAEQTSRAQILQARSGWGQWPACSKKIGVR